jgi:hypothetical protein
MCDMPRCGALNSVGAVYGIKFSEGIIGKDVYHSIQRQSFSRAILSSRAPPP